MAMFMESFRVPKKKNTEILELLSIDSEHRKFLISKITDSFKKPEISKVNMKFHQSWLVNNTGSETKYAKKRLEMRNKSINCSESFGFLFIKSEFDLKKLVNVGHIEIGNLTQSCLAKPEMGVSICQHADIYHPEPPRAGLILIVKFIKGKIYYLPYDPNPMEPQPKYDCHALRPGLSNDSTIKCFKAFHFSQIFLYEYSEDLDIERFPSQILIIGAVKFSWHGPYIYKEVPMRGDQNKINGLKRSKEPEKKGPPVKQARLFPNVSSLQKISTITNKLLESVALSTTLIIGTNMPSPRVNVKVLSNLKESIMICKLISQNWKLIELLPGSVLVDYMKYVDEHRVEHLFHLSNSTINVFPNRFNDNKKMGGSFRPKFATLFQIVTESSNDNKIMSEIIRKFYHTQTVGLIRCNAMSNVLLYIFPTGQISKVLGLPDLDLICSMNAILLTEQHPDFISCNYDGNEKKEQKKFQSLLLEYEYSVMNRRSVKQLLSLPKLRSMALIHSMNQASFIDNLNKNTMNVNNKNDNNKIQQKDVESNCAQTVDHNNIDIVSDKGLPSIVDFPSNLLSGDVDYRFVNNETGGFYPESVNNSDYDNLQDKTLPIDYNLPVYPYSFHCKDNAVRPQLEYFQNNDENKKQSSLSLDLPLVSAAMNTQHRYVDSASLNRKERMKNFLGNFTLVSMSPDQLNDIRRKSAWKKYRQYKCYTQRRPTYLNPQIFENVTQYSHVTVYKG